MASAELAPQPAAAEAEVTQLRAELRAMRRRSAALTLGALLVMGGIVWLALAARAWLAGLGAARGRRREARLRAVAVT